MSNKCNLKYCWKTIWVLFLVCVTCTCIPLFLIYKDHQSYNDLFIKEECRIENITIHEKKVCSFVCNYDYSISHRIV